MAAPPLTMEPPTGQALGDTYGVMLISTVIAAVLYGVTVVLSLYYYDRFPKDPWMLKLGVAVVWALDTTSLVLDVHAIYYYLIANYNNPPALLVQVWSIQVELLITRFKFTAVFVVQIFFIHRIYQLRPNIWYIPLFLALTAVTSYALIIVIVIPVFKNSDWNDVQSGQVNRPLVANWLTGLIVDVSITVVLCWYLWSEKNYVRRGTRRLINRIIIFSVNRGAIAAGAQFLSFVTKFAAPQKLIWLGFHNVLCKVYTNSMLATLNSRVVLRDMLDDGELGGTECDSVFSTSQDTAVGRRGQRHATQVTTLEFAVARSSTLEPRSVGSIDTEDITDMAEKESHGPAA
ncbi:hypothetical protein PYCCODRAFT_1471780 [Trametes coccinea BRFM310]|uniref:DUF6534 domain-containing protein n=1 Tax=Trametes coccinea (strain BRFM310) TaxID=1353009 RepID=A0A1Y2I8M8_TRAC3|nr:hypothetical protein PYCCODRAFT_1471780 [Trametes coccinea BRFM310]